MKKNLFLLLLLAAIMPLGVKAQGWPAGYGGVMLQGFFWDSFRVADGQTGKTMATMYGAGWGENDQWYVPVTTWAELLNQKDNIAPYIDLLWLPQSGATVCPDQSVFTTESSATRAGHNGTRVTTYYGDTINNPDCMGFVPVFYLDHGRGQTYTVNGNTWSPKSYFGTESELINLISAYKTAGTGAVEDVVANHKGGLSTWSGVQYAADFVDEVDVTGPTTGRNYSITWTWDSDGKCVDICNDDESGAGSGNADCGGDAGKGSWARDLDHHAPATQQKVMTYLRYLKDELGYQGFRYDYARGFEPKHFGYYNTEVRPTFSVGEFWGSFDEITTWVEKTYYEGNYQSAAFDFPLQEVIRKAFNDESCQSFRVLERDGLIWDSDFKRYAVTFIDNHDTFKDLPTDASNSNYQHRVSHQIVEANCFILAMPGTPCLFYPHFMNEDWHDDIVTFIKARRTAGITNQSAIWPSIQTGNYGIAWRVTGEKGELYLQLGSESVATGVPDGFTQVWCNTAGTCRLSITSTLADAVSTNEKQDLVYGYPVIDKSSGDYSSAITVNVKPSSIGTTLVYTTNGNTPNAYSEQITDTAGINLTFDETTTLKVGVLANGTVRNSSIVTREYVINSGNDDSKITVYIKYDGGTLPYIYAYDDNDNALTSTYPGWQYSTDNSVVVGGVTWLHATIDASKANIILSYGGDATKSVDIMGVTSDVFYVFNSGDVAPKDVSTIYTQALYNPIVSIDIASGEYTTAITPKLTASNSNAVIVYTTEADATDGSNVAPEPSTTVGHQVTYETTLSFGEGSHSVRAGILYNGEVINQVARTYYIGSGSTLTPETPKTTGVSIYVKSSGTTAPYIYAWHAPGGTETQLSDAWPGNQMTEKKQVGDETWYYYHFENDSLRYIINNGDNTTQTDNLRVIFPGAYFVEYYPDGTSTSARANNVTDDYVDYWSTYNGVTTTVYIEGTNFYVAEMYKKSINLYTWTNSSPNVEAFGAWPGTTMTAKLNRLATDNNYPLYYLHTDQQVDGLKFCLTSGSKYQTNNLVAKCPGDNVWLIGISSTTASDNTATEGIPVAKYRPRCEWQLKYDQYAVSESETVEPSSIPSCATYLGDDVYHIYFENSAPYGAPYAWIYENTTVYTGSCWPGEALVTPIGVAPNGNIIYCWTYTGDITTAPQYVIFNDNGSPQTDSFEFVNGGYYTVDGLVGVVPKNLLTLADLIRFGTVGEDYVISNDLTSVWLNDSGELLWVKDDDGDANTPRYNTSSLPIPKALENESYAQSNWAQLVLKEPVTDLSMTNKTLLGQTVLGTLTNRVNPTIELRANPIPNKSVTYTPNTFVPANFVEQQEYFMVQPQAQEYANIQWAVCSEQENDTTFIFTVPAHDEDNQVNSQNIHGAFRAYVRKDIWQNYDEYSTLMPIQKYYEYNDIVAIVKAIPASSSTLNLPISPDSQSSVSTLWEVDLISLTRPDDPYTSVAQVVGDASLVAVDYYNLLGVRSDKPFQGINIVVKRYSDGSVKASKVLR